MSGLFDQLSRLKLLHPDAIPEPRAAFDVPHPQLLLRLCDAGALRGGLSVARDVRPDELVGPLCAQMGGRAQKLKVLDVLERDPTVLEVELAGRAESWEVEGVEALVERLNVAFAVDPRTCAVAVLGEWEDRTQLWCVPKTALAEVLAQRWFSPANRGSLRAG